ncbi:unnamed protein product (macronuclear) [Paramecium tetraurelia]|uniref:Cyclic nucleotide-binding domain-containing protein n=1 Tax=Paramecium tetraurelia TaxID=5888 RepID=A0D2J3_PARTE|nr:uncharacterized protein GSPATT00012768001 [Paramecium tetraurelia]CAK77260.1 unnamed protein product [Paramecium tetraurelia]|eukprot:XP_001444657.1 hypothetical protein (macronuclear) [Paramecium tetraurelia strain d4-2]
MAEHESEFEGHEEELEAPKDSLWRDEHEMEKSANIVYFLTLGIVSGLILREINKKTKLPYSPMILSLGILLGLLQKSLGYVGESASILSKMHPHLIVFVFVPVLLFESAFNCDWYTFKYQMVNILLLAGPGCGWGAILLGAIFKLVLQYDDNDMTWYQAFTLGSVLSATDPVAVVALLKELGASLAFNHLIEGEALLNDGVAMVFFIFFNKFSKAASGKGEAVTASQVVLNFVRNSLVGPALGLILGILAALWTKRILGDDIEVTWLTFVFTYLTFYWAEFCFFKTSGLLAVVGLGLFWSAFGKTRIRSSVEHSVHTVWGFVQYSCDTLIFLLVGIIVGTQVIEETFIHKSDYIRMIVFYFFMILARFIMILTFWPFLRCFGYPISKSEFIVLVYGGLRGALGLTLSLMVGCDEELPARFRHLSVFYGAGMAAITNLINGTTCKALVQYLEMIENPVVKKKVYKKYLEELIVNSQDKMRELESDQFYSMADWNQIEKLETEIKYMLGSNKVQTSSSNLYEGLTDQEIFGEVRYRIYRILKGLYYDKFEYGLCEEDTVRLLVESSDIGLDHTKAILNIWDQLYKNFLNFSSVNFFFKVKEMPLIGPFARDYMIKHLGFVYDVTTTFLSCASEAFHLTGTFPMSKDAIRVVMEELNKEIEKAEGYLGILNDTFPEIVRAIQTKRASHSILTHQRHYLDDTQQNGLVDEKEYQLLKKEINTRLVDLENHQFDMVLPSFHVLAMEFPIFSGLVSTDLDNIIKSAYEKKFGPDEIIYEQGMTCQNIYIVSKGNVVDEFAGGTIRKGLGTLITYTNLIGDGTCMSTAKTTADSLLYSLNLKILKDLMSKNPDFEFKIYINSLEYLRKMFENQAGPLANVEIKRLLDFLRTKSKLKKFTTNQKCDFIFGGYLFRGELKDINNQVYSQYTYIPPQDTECLVTKDCQCLTFEDSVDSFNNQMLKQLDLDPHKDQQIQERYSQIKRTSMMEKSKLN